MARSSNHSLSSPCLDCVSTLENNLSILYNAITGRVASSDVKGLFESIADDGQKHSIMLKDASEQIAKMKTRQRKNEKLEDLYNMTFTIYEKVVAKEETNQPLENEELLGLTSKLLILENTLTKKYSVWQSRTLKAVGQESLLQQHRTLENFGSMFERLIDDGEQHQKILEGILKLTQQEPHREENLATVTAIPDLEVYAKPPIKTKQNLLKKW